MTSFIITDHAIVPRQMVLIVSTIKADNNLYHIVGYGNEGMIYLYLDVKHEEIITRIQTILKQMLPNTI